MTEAEATRDEPAPAALPQPAKPQRWMLGRMRAHIAGYDDAPPRGDITD